MNRRSLITALFALPGVAAARAFLVSGEGGLQGVERLAPVNVNASVTGGTPEDVAAAVVKTVRPAVVAALHAPKDVLYRPGMRLRLRGMPPEIGPFAANSITLQRHSITDLDTGDVVTNIQSLDLSINASGWMVALVTATRCEGGLPVRKPGGGLEKYNGIAEIEVTDLVVGSETHHEHAERVRRMEEALKAADALLAHMDRKPGASGWSVLDECGDRDICHFEAAYRQARMATRA